MKDAEKRLCAVDDYSEQFVLVTLDHEGWVDEAEFQKAKDRNRFFNEEEMLYKALDRLVPIPVPSLKGKYIPLELDEYGQYDQSEYARREAMGDFTDRQGNPLPKLPTPRPKRHQVAQERELEHGIAQAE